MEIENQPYYIVQAKSKMIPFILSIPHCGIQFPEELSEKYFVDLVKNLDDADWYLDKLYDFASKLGVTTICAKYARWVIDLNREPNSKSLYDDGRLITKLCPTTTFLGENIYRKKDHEPNSEEINRRLKEYYYPYHKKLDEIINELRDEFGKVILWDGHSIRRRIKTIKKEPFPDLILGDNDENTADARFIKAALDGLRSGYWQVKHNDPFKGGFLTRSKGKPKENVHALQLEMSKDLYMNRNETEYDFKKAEVIKKLLKSTFENLISII